MPKVCGEAALGKHRAIPPSRDTIHPRPNTGFREAVANSPNCHLVVISPSQSFSSFGACIKTAAELTPRRP